MPQVPLAAVGWAMMALYAGVSIYSYVQNKKMSERMKKGEGSEYLLNQTTVDAIIPVVFGRHRVGCNIVYRNVGISGKRWLCRIHTWAEGPIQAIDDVIFDDRTYYGSESGETFHTGTFEVRWSHDSEWGGSGECDYMFRTELTEASPSAQGIVDWSPDWDTNYDIPWNVTMTDSSTHPPTYDFNWSEEYGAMYSQFLKVTRSDGWTYDAGLTRIEDGEYGNCRVSSYLGTGSQTVPSVIAEEDAEFAEWDSPLRYTAHSYIRLDGDRGVWYNGIPQVTCLMRGLVCEYSGSYSSGWPKYTTNPAIHIYNLLVNTRFGMEVPVADIDTDSFDEVAEFCDLEETGKLPYVCNVVFYEDERAIDMISKIEECFALRLLYSGGKYYLRYFDTRYESSVDDVLDNDVVQDSLSLTVGEVNSRPTELKVVYPDEKQKWIEVEQTITHSSYTKLGIRNEISAKLQCITDREMALYRGSYIIERAIFDYQISFTMRHKGLLYEEGDLVTLYFEAYGWDESGQLARVVTATPNEERLVEVVCELEKDELYDGQLTSIQELTSHLTDLPSPWDFPPHPDYVSGELLELKEGGARVVVECPMVDFPWIAKYELYASWWATDDSWVYIGSCHDLDAPRFEYDVPYIGRVCCQIQPVTTKDRTNPVPSGPWVWLDISPQDVGDVSNVAITHTYRTLDKNICDVVISWDPPDERVDGYLLFGTASSDPTDFSYDSNPLTDELFPQVSGGSGTVQSVSGNDLTIQGPSGVGTWDNDALMGKLLFYNGGPVKGQDFTDYCVLIQSNTGNVITIFNGGDISPSYWDDQDYIIYDLTYLGTAVPADRTSYTLKSVQEGTYLWVAMSTYLEVVPGQVWRMGPVIEPPIADYPYLTPYARLEITESTGPLDVAFGIDLTTNSDDILEKFRLIWDYEEPLGTPLTGFAIGIKASETEIATTYASISESGTDGYGRTTYTITVDDGPIATGFRDPSDAENLHAIGALVIDQGDGDYEYIVYTGINEGSNQFTGCIRAQEGTSELTLEVGDDVKYGVTINDYWLTADSIGPLTPDRRSAIYTDIAGLGLKADWYYYVTMCGFIVTPWPPSGLDPSTNTVCAGWIDWDWMADHNYIRTYQAIPDDII